MIGFIEWCNLMGIQQDLVVTLNDKFAKECVVGSIRRGTLHTKSQNINYTEG